MATRDNHTILDIERENLGQIVPNYDVVQQGLAQDFRKTINDNFTGTEEVVQKIVDDIKETDGKINGIVQEIWDGMVNIQLSVDEPIKQQLGDFWFKIIE